MSDAVTFVGWCVALALTAAIVGDAYWSDRTARALRRHCHQLRQLREDRERITDAVLSGCSAREHRRLVREWERERDAVYARQRAEILALPPLVRAVYRISP